VSRQKPVLGVGICGLGFMGRTYFNLLRSHSRAQVVAVCDRNERLLRGDWSDAVGNLGPQSGQRVDLEGIAVYRTPQELVADPRVDAVIVALPTPLHAEIAVLALQAGRHVLCEKPMARTLEEADRMIAAAKASCRTLMIAQCIRFWPQYVTIRELVRSGRLGRVRLVKLARLACTPLYSEGNWLLNGRESGGALLDLHVHDVDCAQWLLGVPARLAAWGWSGPSGETDHVVASFEFQSGALAVLEGSWLYPAPWPFEMAITVCGDAAAAVWSSRAGPDVRVYGGGTSVEVIRCPDQTGWQHELDYFIGCVLDGRAVDQCTPESSRLSLALVLLEKDSIRLSAPVPVPAELRAS
jgi:predicted dehydrogenase